MARRRRRPALILAVLAFFLLCEVEVVQTALALGQAASSPFLRTLLGRVFPAVAVLLALGPFLHVPTMLNGRRLPGWVMGYLAPSYLFVVACAAHGFFGLFLGLGRSLLGLAEASLAARAVGLAVPFVLVAYGASTGQLWTRVERLPMVLRGLGAGLVGLRVVQLSDLHAGGLVGERRLRRIARKVSRLKPDLIVVTGDIVNASPLDAMIVAPILGELARQAPLGLVACMGNHDHFVDGEEVARILTAAGVRLLRNAGEVIRRGEAALWLAGVDDTWTGKNDLDLALAQKPAGLPTLLLAHDPNLWPEAVARQVEVTLSGHTHGGQIGLLKLHPSISLARLITPFVAGWYERDGAQLYVSRGTANTLPLRLGAPTEVSLFELQSA
jgi:predicted MPP superfamily phosphohydrolase